MIYLVAAQTVAIVAIVGGFLWYLRESESRTQAERASLLTRIQRPEVLQIPHMQFQTPPRVQVDESDLVGAVFDRPGPDE